ncbi:Uncharacterised protein [Mycobacteroides abscessus subsp. abscessus]|nr:Uncharacterised protein [Mycobacteroides abscessus subsp. abscessus]
MAAGVTSMAGAPISSRQRRHSSTNSIWCSFMPGLLPAGLNVLGPAMRKALGNPGTASPR